MHPNPNPNPELPPSVVDLHGLSLSFQTSSPALNRRFKAVYGHLPRARQPEPGLAVHWKLDPSPTAPQPPANLPVVVDGDLVSYYGDANEVTIRMPRYALLTVDLLHRRIQGTVTRNCLEVYGAFEDVMMISLAPLFRRRGWFPLHAFAALAPVGRAALITGQMGSGKTTTGLALLSAGWKLLSNDSPLLVRREGQIHVLAYPGWLSAFDDSLARFEHLQKFIPAQAPRPEEAPSKRVFRAEAAFANPWAATGAAGGLFFPQVVPGLADSELVPVDSKQAMLTLMPQAIEGWDKAMVGPNLQLIGQLVEQLPCYTLRLSPQVAQLPGLIAGGLAG